MAEPVVIGGTSIPVEPRRVLSVLLMVNVMFTVLHLFAQWMRFHGQDVFDTTFPGAELFDLNREVSIATWWQQTQLTAAGALAILLGFLEGREGGRERRLWTGLGCIFIYIALDDGSEVHERATEPLRALFGVDGGLFYYAWIIPALALLAVFGVTYFRFWMRRPAGVRWSMAVAGAVYVCGSMGGEMASGAYDGRYGQDYGYSFLTAVEESLEMVGQSVFIMALLVALVLRSDGGRPTASGVTVESES